MIFTFLFITGLSLLVTHWVQNRRWKAKLPPGPKGYPIIGNLLGQSPRIFSRVL